MLEQFKISQNGSWIVDVHCICVQLKNGSTTLKIEKEVWYSLVIIDLVKFLALVK